MKNEILKFLISNCSNYSKQIPSLKSQLGHWEVGNYLGQLGIRLIRSILLVVFSFSFLVFTFPPKVDAAFLSLDPATKSTPVGESFEVNLNINTEGEKTTSADSVMTFDNTILEVSEIKQPSDPFFPEMFKNISGGELYIGASVRDSIDTREGSGTIATITFKGKGQGTSDVKFDCTPGKTSDSNIAKNDKNFTDIIDCNKNVNGRYTVGAGAGGPEPTSTPQPTSPPASQPTAVPTLPPSGTVEVTLGILGIGAFLTILGIGTKILLGF